jgi:hypothetical protein
MELSMIPFQITFLDFPKSDAVWMAAQKRIEKLELFFYRIIRFEVVISCPHRHRHADRVRKIRHKVKFLEEPGEKGPQVTSMAVI